MYEQPFFIVFTHALNLRALRILSDKHTLTLGYRQEASQLFASNIGNSSNNRETLLFKNWLW